MLFLPLILPGFVGPKYGKAAIIVVVRQQRCGIDDADRFAKLALKYPDMLNHHEQVLWKLIRENGYLWRGRTKNDKWTWEINEGDLIYERLRDNWEKFNDVASGNADRSVLPTWSNSAAQPQKPPPKSSGDLLDDEIPF